MKLIPILLFPLVIILTNCSTMPSYYDDKEESIDIILNHHKYYRSRPGYPSYYAPPDGGRSGSYSLYLNKSSARNSHHSRGKR